MSNYNFTRISYITLNILLVFLSVAFIAIGVLTDDLLPIFLGTAWTIVSLMRILVVSNNNGNETIPLISHA